MHTRDYAAAALMELSEELERLSTLSASSETLGTAYNHSAQAIRRLISPDFRPWLEDELARIRDLHQLSDISALSSVAETLSELVSELKVDVLPVLGADPDTAA